MGITFFALIGAALFFALFFCKALQEEELYEIIFFLILTTIFLGLAVGELSLGLRS